MEEHPVTHRLIPVLWRKMTFLDFVLTKKTNIGEETVLILVLLIQMEGGVGWGKIILTFRGRFRGFSTKKNSVPRLIKNVYLTIGGSLCMMEEDFDLRLTQVV